MKKDLLILTLTLFLSTPFSPVSAQTISCGTDAAMQELYANNPSSQVQRENWEQAGPSSEILISSNGDCEEHIVIPTVFHVYHTGGSSSVTMAQIQSALDKANEDFNMQNSDANTVDPAFMSIRGSMNITFALAQTDPNGNPTNGVNYYGWASGFGTTGMNSTIASYAWDNYKYLNIYIMTDLYGDGVTNNSGIAWLPDTWMSDNGLARIVYNDIYLGNTGTSVADSEFQSVFTHEIGHYLDLHHTFENGCSAPGDYVDDTPPTQGQWGCGPNAISCGNATNGENYMDYNSSCYKMFTQGQVARMEDGLNHPTRFPLWQKNNLTATGTWSEYEYASDVPVAAFTVSDTVVFVGGSVTFTDASCGFPTSRSWSFLGGSPGSSSSAVQNVTYNSPGTYIASLNVSNANGPAPQLSANIHVIDAPECVFAEDFETTSTGNIPTGWNQQGGSGIEFSVENDVAISYPETGTFTAYGHSGQRAIYCHENWDAGIGGPTELRLRTSMIDLNGVIDPRLTYWDLRGWDNLWPATKPEHIIEVQVSNTAPNGPWTTIHYDTTHESQFQQWRPAREIDLSDYQGEQIYVSFYTNTHHYYWRMDDLCVYSEATVGLPEIGVDSELNYLIDGNHLWVDAEEFQLWDVTGRYTAQGNRNSPLDISGLNHGIYFITASEGTVMKSAKLLITTR